MDARAGPRPVAPGAPGEPRRFVRWRRASPATRTVLLIAAMAGVAVVLFVVGADPIAHDPLRWWALVPMFSVAELTAVHFEYRNESHSFSMSEIPLLLGLVFSSPEELLAARLIANVLVSWLRWHQPIIKLSFNLGLFCFETGIAVALFAALDAGGTSGPPLWFAAAGSVIAATVFGVLCVHRVITWHTGERGGRGRFLVVGLYGAGANVSVALIGWRLAAGDRLALVFLAVVCSLVFVTSRAYAALHQRYGGLRLLYGFTRTIGDVTGGEAVTEAALAEAAALFRSRVAAVARPRIDRGFEVVRTGRVDGLEAAVVAPPTALLDRLRAVDGPVVIGVADPDLRAELARVLGAEDGIAAPLRQDGEIVGFVAVGGRLGLVVSTFDEEDGRLFGTLVNHLDVALRNGQLVDRLRDEVALRVHQALHDTLTGLPNRMSFHQQLEDHLGAGARSAAVLLMDLDRFKEINDTLGHHSGDVVLRDVGARLLGALPPDALVARLGGDEFAVLLPGSDAEAASAHAAAVQTSLRAPVVVEDLALDVGVSIGFALWPEHGAGATALLQRADVAMYAAKRSSSGIEGYRDDLDSHSPRRLTLAGELRTAVESGRIEVHYQPKARIADGRIVGVEALARWTHPVDGPIPPDEFIPLAEQTGVLRPLTEHVLAQALEQHNILAAAGHSIGVAVNLSSRSLLDTGLPDLVAQALDDHGVDPRWLTLEITETNVMADDDRCSAVLRGLDALGVGLSVDDFGTGYSSLSYLQRLPVDEVKIDKSFVLTMSTDAASKALVSSIITMGRNLGLRVVAEGVEDAAAWTSLRAAGCDVAQGYLIARPLPGDDLLALLADQGRAPAAVAHATAV